jgi:adenosine kinase
MKKRLLDRNPGIFIVVTNGEKGAVIHQHDDRIEIPVVQPDAIKDPTGVGDAFRGGFLTGYCHGLDLNTCGRMGALAATFCLEERGPQGQNYTISDLLPDTAACSLTMGLWIDCCREIRNGK